MDDLKIVFSDVDGTLLDSRQEITPRTLRALKLLQKKGDPIRYYLGAQSFWHRTHCEEIRPAV